MKKIMLFMGALLGFTANAQNINDVLLHSSEDIYGTARFQSMGGAFGALGGDLSALGINPAGAAVFNNSLFTATATSYNTSNDAFFQSRSNLTKFNNLEINQIGGVFVFKDKGSSPWKKISFAINYDLIQNHDDEFYASGNNTTGIDNYFLDYAEGVAFGDILLQDNEYIEEAYLDIGSAFGYGHQQAFLGYFGGLIDPVDANDVNNTSYISNAQYSTVNQEFSQRTSGYNGKFGLTFAGQYQENLYLGASLNFNSVLYDRYTEFSESGYDAGSSIQFTHFDNRLRTEGNGFSFALGGIAKLNESLRIGGSYQSPTWYNMLDETAQRINSDLADDEIDYIDFNIVNLFEEYTIKTPSKITGSAALVFGKQGLLSFDYGYQDMSKAELRPTSDPSFADENQVISNALGAVNSYRLGGEYRIEQVSLRAGYRYEDNPYVSQSNNNGTEGYSLGLGYSFGGSRIDLSFNQTERTQVKPLFETGLTSTAFVDKSNTNVALTYTLNF